MDLGVEWLQVGSHLTHIGIAFLLALPIGLNREMRSESAGLRTFPLVAIAACGYMLTGLYVAQTESSEMRVFYGIITGIGFIGGGAILKNSDGVAGTATAASIWNTGAIGIAVAYRRYEIAIALAAINFAILQLTPPIKEKLREASDGKKDD